MSRSGYCDDFGNQWELIMWRGQVASATRGKRGQQLLRDTLAALEALPEKRLIVGELVQEGEVCTLGATGLMRGIDMKDLDPTEPDDVAAAFNCAPQLAREIVYMNDEYCRYETPEERFESMVKWVKSQIREVPA